MAAYAAALSMLFGMGGVASAESASSAGKLSSSVTHLERIGLRAVPAPSADGDFTLEVWATGSPPIAFCLDAAKDQIRNGGVVQLWRCHDYYAPQQLWTWVGDYLKNKASPAGTDFVLDAAADQIRHGGKVQLWRLNYGPQQRWEPFLDNRYRNGASPAGTDFVLDAAADQIRDGGKIQLWTVNYQDPYQQQWSSIPCDC